MIRQPIQCTVNWNPSSATDTYAYIIFKFYNGSWSPVDTVFGRLSNSSYYDTATTTTFGNQSVQYAVAAMDGWSLWESTLKISPVQQD